jgi:hypothetical protein
MRRGAVYLAEEGRRPQLSAIQDLVVIASTLASLSVVELLSPSTVEARFCDMPFFASFRSKEVWLDAYALMQEHPDWYALSAAGLSISISTRTKTNLKLVLVLVLVLVLILRLILIL